ncbi:response regulator [bacterium]|nr:response regulator [bacterium]
MEKILVIDDDDHLRLLYKLELERQGYEVSCADNGRDAMPVTLAYHPDLIILDIMMPQGDGIDYLRWLVGNHIQIPVIIYSAHAHYKSNFISWGADAYLIKSSDLTELKTEVKKILQQRQLS